MACVSHVHMHGVCAISKISMLKYLSSLAGMQADLNIGKLTTSHFQKLNLKLE